MWVCLLPSRSNPADGPSPKYRSCPITPRNKCMPARNVDSIFRTARHVVNTWHESMALEYSSSKISNFEQPNTQLEVCRNVYIAASKSAQWAHCATISCGTLATSILKPRLMHQLSPRNRSNCLSPSRSLTVRPSLWSRSTHNPPNTATLTHATRQPSQPRRLPFMLSYRLPFMNRILKLSEHRPPNTQSTFDITALSAITGLWIRTPSKRAYLAHSSLEQVQPYHGNCPRTL